MSVLPHPIKKQKNWNTMKNFSISS